MERKKLHKVDILKLLAKETGLPKVQLEFVYESLLDIIRERLLAGEEVYIPKLGTFNIRDSYFAGKVSRMTGTVIPKQKRISFALNNTLKKEFKRMSRED